MENNKGNLSELDILKNEISDLKKKLEIAQDKLEQFEDFPHNSYYKKIIEKTGNFFTIVDKFGTIKYCSKKIKDAENSVIIGRNIFELINSYIPENHQSVNDIVLNLSSNNSFIVPIQSNGEIVWYENFTVKINDDNENPEFLITTNNISKSKSIELELLSTKENYQDLFNTVKQAIYIQNPDLTFIDVNQGAVDMYGYEREYFIGKNPGFLSAPGLNDLDEVVRIVNKAFSGIPQKYEFWGLRKNGEVFPKDVWSIRGKYSGKDVVITLANDITDTKKAEDELKANELKYRSIVENTNEWIWEIDLHGRNTFSNEGVIHILGYSIEEFTNLADIDIMHPEDRKKTQDKLNQHIIDKTGWKNWIVRWIHKDGSLRYLESNAIPIINKNDELLGFRGSDRDITDRILSEKVLNETNSRLLHFIEALPEAVFLKDSEGRWLNINKTASKLFNVNNYNWHGKSEKEMADERQEYREYHLQCFDTDEAAWNSQKMMICEEKIYGKDNKFHYYEVRKIPVFDDSGNRKSMIVIGKDITESKNIELLQKIQYNIANSVVSASNIKELFEIVEKELAQLFDTSNMFIANYDETTDMINCIFEQNTKNDDIKIWSAKDSLTGYLIRTKKPLLLKREEIDQLQIDGEIQFLGERCQCWLGVPMIIENKVLGVLVLQSYDNPFEYDVSSVAMLEVIANQLVLYMKQKLSEEMIIMLSKATEHSPVSFVITDPEGKIEYVNKKFAEVSGYQFDEVIGLKPNILKSGFHSDEFFKKLWDTIINGIDWKGEICSKTKSGDLIWENVWISRIMNDQNEIIHFVAVKEDISEMKKLLVDLSEAKEMAEENDILKSAFLANMSHEIRTPMNAIIGFSSLLDDENLSVEERKEFLKIINKKGNDLLNLINDILDLSKLESKQLKLFYTENIINPLLYELTITFRSLIDTNGFSESVGPKNHLKVNIGKSIPDSMVFTTDFARLDQILTNLISNAIKFTEKGEIEIGCYIETEHYLTFYVKDTGIGIPKEKISLIFERFQQADSNYNTRKYGGTGLGLSIVKGLVELLGGKIWVESEVNVGSTFFFNIPVVFSNKSVFSTKNIDIANFEEELVILVAEDEKSNYFLIENILKRNFKVEIHHAWNGKEAVDILNENNNINLVLMDIKMPVLNGFEAFREIRKTNEDIPIVAITAYAMNEEKDRIIKTGFNSYLSKPFKTEDLVNIINRIVKSKTFKI
jgi:PAS domain S-box-containing protein